MDELESFVEMARTFPLRTCLCSVVLPLFALVQLVNVVLHDGSVVLFGGLALVLVAYSVAFTRYQVATFRRRQIEDSLHAAE